MTKGTVALLLLAGGVMMWFDPGFNGVLFERSNISLAEGRTIAAILFVGAAIVWMLPGKRN